MMCFVVLSSLTFFMTTGTIANDDNSFWLQETTISIAYTTQEGIGAETLSNVTERVLVDSRYAEVIGNTPHGVESIVFSSEQQINSTHGSIFLWRRYMLDGPISKYVALEGYYKPLVRPEVLGTEFLTRLDNLDKMYDNHGIEGYYIPSMSTIS